MTTQFGSLEASAARFESTFRVRFDEAGADGLARPSTLLRFAQDAAWQHGSSLGLDRAWYEEHQLVWLVRAVSLEIHDPIPMGATLRISTAVIGHRRIWARRRVEMRLAESGEPAVTGRPASGPARRGPGRHGPAGHIARRSATGGGRSHRLGAGRLGGEDPADR